MCLRLISNFASGTGRPRRPGSVRPSSMVGLMRAINFAEAACTARLKSLAERILHTSESSSTSFG